MLCRNRCSRRWHPARFAFQLHAFRHQEREFQRLVKTLVRDDHIFVSDRKLGKLYKLFRVRSWLLSGGTVTRDDLRLLAYLGETHDPAEVGAHD